MSSDHRIKLEGKPVLQGSILDIGGGGEGIIGCLYGSQVVAIDRSAEELAEIPAVCEKVVMDATRLDFGDSSFDNVTFFYSLMYMTADEQRMAISEAVRVLKPGGKLILWDCEILSAWPEPFCVELDIILPDRQIHTTYGIGKLDGQSRGSVTAMCMETGLTLMASEEDGGCFYLLFEKR